MSGTVPLSAGKSWASIVGSDLDPDLEFHPLILVDGVLQIPEEVVDFGVQKFKSALVGQFLGPALPLKVFQSLANRLWDYDGYVSVSELSKDTFLIEFPTVSVCDWVLNRLWHVHHLPLFLKRWSLHIEPIILHPSEIPVWIQLTGVPVLLCTHLGIGHLASLVGKPISKFVRNGIDVKVCVLMSSVDERPDTLKVTIAGIIRSVKVVYPESRVYGTKQNKANVEKVKDRTVWQQKQSDVVVSTDNAARSSRLKLQGFIEIRFYSSSLSFLPEMYSLIFFDSSVLNMSS
ncbi:hypothetical protein LINPERPRIM_LOCUS37955 [Linum perenne]